jgi:hypothetical protein
MPVTLWLLLRGYHGLVGDAQIYAVQALSRIHPQFAGDLYLQNTSQDRFTIFSPVYAWFIACFGLEQSALFLTLLFTMSFLVATWSVTRTLAGKEAAWLAVCFLVIVVGDYGGSGVFRILDQFLTARLPAEAMVVASLACFVSGHRWLSLGIAAAALPFHPLVAFPGLLLLICLWTPNRVGSMGALLGVLIAMSVAIGATAWSVPALQLMDPLWLDTVQERSQFLFLQLWSFRDWELNVRPFLYLALAFIVTEDIRIRKVCAAAALVGAAGLTVALIAGLIGPVAILIQGQAWRWEWISEFVAILLLPVTVMRVWQDQKCGPLCAILLVSGWTLPAIDGTVCVSLAMLAWLMRENISARGAAYFRLLTIGLAASIVCWTLLQVSRTLGLSTKITASGWRGALPSISEVRSVFELPILGALVVALIYCWLRKKRHLWQLLLLAVVLFGTSISLLPSAFKQAHRLGLAADTDAFADWRNAIPPTSTVLVVPARDVGSFVWFTLQRPNYLTVDQSAGVVFSRATALEIRRRSNVLLPVMDPDWKIRSHLREDATTKRIEAPTGRPLTTNTLEQICNDPALGFVISSQNVGFEALHHIGPGPWKDRYLYDCRNVRQSAPRS